ncbi:MAG: TonB family protein [Dokdonella sp.]
MRQHGALSMRWLLPLLAIVVLATLALVVYQWRSPEVLAVTPGASASATMATPLTTKDVAPEVDAIAAMDTNALLERARKAMNEDRLVAPAGDNAVAWYLQIRKREPNDRNAADALRELFPFASGVAERALSSRDLAEGERVIALLTEIDPNNYGLNILRGKLASQRKLLERDQQREIAAIETTAANRTAQTQTSPAPTTRAPGAVSSPATDSPATSSAGTPSPGTSAPGTSAAQAVANAAAIPSSATTGNLSSGSSASGVRKDANPKTVVATAQPALNPATVAAIANRDATLIRDIQPAYPREAYRGRTEGWVELEFTITAQGTVENAHVVSSNPTRVFDREALQAIQQARFEPMLRDGQAISTSMKRRFEFHLGG